MEPLATLHHFVHPQWFEKLGAFEREENISLFLAWTRLAFQCALTAHIGRRNDRCRLMHGTTPLFKKVWMFVLADMHNWPVPDSRYKRLRSAACQR